MTGRLRTIVVALVAATLLSGLAPARAADDPPRPNVLVILADDLGFSDLGAYGGEIDTPNLDRLAAGGLVFTHAYNTARCWPTRAALLTGYYPQAIRRDALPAGAGGTNGKRPAWATLLPERLAAAGYRSYHSGKWHIDGDPRGAGFVRSLDVLGAGQSNYFDPGGVTEDGKPIAAGDEFYTTTAIGDHAVRCLAEHARDHAGTPFFHYVAFTAPHFPVQAPADVIETYRERYLSGWDSVRAARCGRVRDLGIVTTEPAAPEPDVGAPYQPDARTLERLGPGELDRPRAWDALTEAQQDFQATKMAIHAAMVDMMDREVGRIVAQVEAMGVFDDTLILFLSDNGASAEIMIRGEGHDPAAPAGSRPTFLCLGPGWSTCANAPFRRHKTWVHEGGIATPWIVHWPRGIAEPGKLRRQPVHAIDLVPTVLEIARLPEHDASVAPPLQGRSFTRPLADPAAPPAHESLWWCHEGHRAVRMGDWKLVAVKGGPWELYDLATDRSETKNLAAAHPDRVTALETEWNRIAEECRGMAAEAGTSSTRANVTRAPRPCAGRRPNIIYVMTDDQGYGDLAAHGNRIIQTPNLDRLREQSVRLTEFHVSPTCAPTRAALLTGRHEFRSGVTHTIHERERLALDAVTLPQLLEPAGYTSGIFGKWHLGDEDDYQPGKRGFDRVFIHGGGGIGQTYPGSCGDAPGNTYFDPVIRSDGAFVRTQGYCTDVFFDAAIEWIDRCRKDRNPFFCYLTPNCPHSPYDCPPGADAKYLALLEAAGIQDPKQRATIARFYAMIENIDTNMGRLLAKLDEWGLAEDTLVVFTTDNGTAAGGPVFNDGMRGTKGSPYRGGTRVPAFWRWPGTLPAGVDVTALTAHIDVTPTICALAGGIVTPAVAPRFEGRSLVPLLENAEAEWPARLLVTHVGRWDRGKAAESGHRNCRVRDGRWQLVNVKNRPDSWELYDLAADPGEKRNVAGEHPDVVARLGKAYDSWWASMQGDLVNENLDGPKENPFAIAFRDQLGPDATAAPQPAPKPASPAAEPARRRDPAAVGRRHPNIVFFLCDDLGTGDVGALGGKDIQTPHIDALFARGTRLTWHWAGNAVCAPSRCVLLTGKHPGHAVVRSNREVKPEGQFPMPAGTVTLAKILHDAGYATGGFGKWGLGAPGSVSDPIAAGFDRFYGYNCQREAHTFYPGHLWSDRERVVLDNPAMSGDPQVARGGTVPAAAAGDEAAFARFTGRQYSADLIANEQLAFIREHAARPFFLYVPTAVPHLALQVPADEPSLVDYEKHFGDEEPYLGGRGYVPCRRPLATYAAMITRMDREVGRIVGLLDELGLADDTIFVFTSDNGATGPGTGGIDTARLQSNGALRDWKGSPYEGGLRVPTAIAWPGRIPAGRTLATPTGFEDWMPTLLDLAGLHDRIPAGGDGVSLAAVLEGTAAPPADRHLYRELTEGKWQAVTDGRWKAVRRAVGPNEPQRAKPTELFDLSGDPAETTDVAAKHPEIVQRLEGLMDREHVPHPDWPLPFADIASRRAAASPAAATAAPPNVVVIFIDDLGYGDIGPFGATRQKTPHLDRMAAEGRRFTSFYAAPACSVSRAQLLTGCYGPRVGDPWVYFPADPKGLNPAEVTVAERLRPLGYATACIGKWHLGDQPEFLPTRQGFDRYLGIPYSNDMQKVSAATGQRVVPLVRDDAVAELLTDEDQRRIVERLTDEAVRFIAESKDRPFFLYLPHTAVHLPLFPGKAFAGRTGNGPFGDWVEEVDWSVGRVLDALREQGLDEKTLVIFTSDNGPWIGPVKDFTSAGPLRGSKGSTWEGGVRVPMIARWPGRIPAGSACDVACGTIDLLPTFVALAGGTVPAEPVIDGRDMAGLLLGTATDGPREAHYYFAPGELQAVRAGRWKLAVASQPEGMSRKGPRVPASLDAPRLYDLEADVGETTDVAAAHPAVVARLRGLAERMRAELVDPASPARRPPGQVAHPTTLYPVRKQPAAAPPPGTREETKPARAARR